MCHGLRSGPQGRRSGQRGQGRSGQQGQGRSGQWEQRRSGLQVRRSGLRERPHHDERCFGKTRRGHVPRDQRWQPPKGRRKLRSKIKYFG